jgi:hypothetical protein
VLWLQQDPTIFQTNSLCNKCWQMFWKCCNILLNNRHLLHGTRFSLASIFIRSRVSSGSIVSDYGLDDRAIEVRSPAGAENFSSSLCVQTGSGVHPASCPMGTGDHSLGVKRGRGVTLTTHPHLVPRSRMSRSYTSSPPQAPPWRVSGTALPFDIYSHIKVMSCCVRSFHGRVHKISLLYPISSKFSSHLYNICLQDPF